MARLTQEQAIDNLVAVFEAEVQTIVAEARRETLRFLQDRLGTTDGVIDRTQANARVLARVEDAFKGAMRKAGYDELVNEYVGKFNGQFDYFSDTLENLGEQIGRNLTVTFGDRDKALFLQQQGQAKDLLQQAVDMQAKAAQQQALFSVGAIKASDLTALISEKLDMTPGRASAIADTSLSTFYRTIADRGYQQVEKQLGKDIELVYRYGGPNDKLTRRVCREWLAGTAEKGWTRKHIEGLSNGSLPNVFLTAGGFRCRHQWLAVATVNEDVPASASKRDKAMPAGLSREEQVQWVIGDGSKWREAVSKRPFMQQLTRDLRTAEKRLVKLGTESDDVYRRVNDLLMDGAEGKQLGKRDGKWLDKQGDLRRQRKALTAEVARLQRQIGDNVAMTLQPSPGWKLPEDVHFSSTEWERGVKEFERLVGPIKSPLFPANGGPAEFGKSFAEYGQRSYYDSEDNHRVSLGSGAGERTVVHELGHWLDDTRPDIGRLAVQFREYRTQGDPLLYFKDTHPEAGYKPYESYRRDRFMKEYIGKVYNSGKASEITSMGLEYMHAEAGTLFQQDREYFDFILGLIRQARRVPMQFNWSTGESL